MVYFSRSRFYISLLVPITFVLAAAVQAPPPGSYFNFSGWTLQTPFPKGTGIQEIAMPELATYSSSCFYTDTSTGTSAVFFAPENGAHTQNSQFPRSELRELKDFDIDSKGGTHVANATVRVLTDGTQHAITIGQLHGILAGGGSCSIIIELEWEAGDIVAHLRDKACKGVKFTVGSGYKFGDPISYQMIAVGNTVQVITDSGSMKPYSYSWFEGTSYSAYFKAGSYLQSSGTSSSIGGTVILDALVTRHSM